MDVLELHRMKAAKVEEAKALVAKAEAENRDFTPEENDAFKRLDDGVAELTGRIERQERMGGYSHQDATKPDMKAQDDPAEEFGSRGAFLQAVADAARTNYRRIDPRLEKRAITGMAELVGCSVLTSTRYLMKLTSPLGPLQEIKDMLGGVMLTWKEGHKPEPTIKIDLDKNSTKKKGVATPGLGG